MNSGLLDNHDDKLFKKALASALNPQLQLLSKKKNTRRKHRNSHLGCGTCKKRRIKCDENLPSCLNCLKGKLHCAYLNLDPNARNALRMAQYNQNIRNEKYADEKPDANSPPASQLAGLDGKDEDGPKIVPLSMQPPLQPQMYQQMSMVPGEDVSPSHLPNATHQSQQDQNASQTPGQSAAIIQTPYGPMVQVLAYPMSNVMYSGLGVPVVHTVPQVMQVPLPMLQNQSGYPLGSQMPVVINQQMMVPGMAQQQQQQQQLPLQQPLRHPLQAMPQPLVQQMAEHMSEKQGPVLPPLNKSPHTDSKGTSSPTLHASGTGLSATNISENTSTSSTNLTPSTSQVLPTNLSSTNLSGLQNIKIKSESPETKESVKLAPIQPSEDKVPTISKLLS